MSDYNNEAGLPPTIPPPDWIHNVSCYSPLLLQGDPLQSVPFSLMKKMLNKYNQTCTAQRFRLSCFGELPDVVCQKLLKNAKNNTKIVKIW